LVQSSWPSCGRLRYWSLRYNLSVIASREVLTRWGTEVITNDVVCKRCKLWPAQHGVQPTRLAAIQEQRTLQCKLRENRSSVPAIGRRPTSFPLQGYWTQSANAATLRVCYSSGTHRRPPSICASTRFPSRKPQRFSVTHSAQPFPIQIIRQTRVDTLSLGNRTAATADRIPCRTR